MLRSFNHRPLRPDQQTLTEHEGQIGEAAVSILVYLNEDVLKLETAQRLDDGKFGFKGCNRIRLSYDDEGRLRFKALNEFVAPEWRIPSILQPFVTCVSLRKDFLNRPARRIGRYQSGETIAILERHPREPGYVIVTVQGKDMASVDELYRQIRTGTAIPHEDWESIQRGAPTSGNRPSIRFVATEDELSRAPDLSAVFQLPRSKGGS